MIYPLIAAHGSTDSARGIGLDLSGLEIEKTVAQTIHDPEFQINLSITNKANRMQQYILIIDIRMDNKSAPSTYLNFAGGALKASGSTTVSSLWTPSQSGRYEMRVFAIDDFDSPEIVTPVLTRIVSVNITGNDVDYSSSSEPFTIILIPDTQNYWDSGNEKIAYNQSQWIVENRERLNIKAVIHLGDIVDNWNSESQWSKADQMMKILDDNHVPYIVSVGNHDIGSPYSSTSDRNYRNFERFFPDPRIVGNQSWDVRKITENGANTFANLSVGENEFLIVSMEYCPSLAVIERVNEVLENNADKRIIFASHAFLRTDGTWNSVSGGGVCTKIHGTDDYSAEAIWDFVIYPHSGIFLTVSGHSAGENKRIDKNQDGDPVQQVVIDYQYKSNGGDGMLKIITFYPERDMINFETYSPWLNSYVTRDRSQFEFNYDMS
jgi:hypothetical protein